MMKTPSLIDSALDLIFPKICSRCGDKFQQGLSNILCKSCFDSIPTYLDPVCSHCGVSLPPRAFENSGNLRCAECGEKDYHLDRTWSLGEYQGALRLAHHAFKFEGMEGLREILADKLAGSAPGDFWSGVEALVPVPLSPERERERGYNPAFLLAERLSTRIRIPVRPLLRKTRSTKPQTALSKEERLKNPTGAYGWTW
jgi:predicted amidophosphoribosyltransferase